MEGIGTVLVFLCVIPFVIFLAGFLIGRWSKGIRIVRDGADTYDPRFAAPSQNRGGNLKRIATRNAE